MPAMIPTEYTATVTWLGRVPHRDDENLIVGEPVLTMELTFAGMAGEHHGGQTRPSCSRVTALYPVGTEIRNVRQLSILSSEELSRIAAAIDLPEIDPAWLGASLVIEGIPDFSHVPPSARLQAESGATLVVDMNNRPCKYPARTIERARPGHGKGFKAAAVGLRGVTAWVEREGRLTIGETLRLHIPDQRAWQPG